MTVTLLYRWERAPGNTDGAFTTAVIPGATDTTYQPVEADVGFRVRGAVSGDGGVTWIPTVVSDVIREAGGWGTGAWGTEPWPGTPPAPGGPVLLPSGASLLLPSGAPLQLP